MKNILGVLLISMSVIVSAQNSIRPVTGIIAMDCSGKTWDFDSLLNAGIHVVIHETIST